MRNYKYSSADVTDEGMQYNYEALMRLKPKALRGYGSALYILARYIEKKKLPVCPIKVILTTGEVLMPEYRRKMPMALAMVEYYRMNASKEKVFTLLKSLVLLK